MTDPLNSTQVTPAVRYDWRSRVNGIIAGVRREAIIYCSLGMVAYISAAIACLVAIREPSLAAFVVMAFFQLMVLFFATTKIYPCIRGGFLVSVEQTCESIGDMKAIREAIERDTTKVPARGAREIFETKP
ncbi:MAG: hypothetical protein L0220_28245 [Acidobacteria bacterium]|nr:hypothetical protein [Acidobacteriota bacterium]